MNIRPKNWPPTIVYLTQPTYSPQLTNDQRQALRVRPPELTTEIPSSLRRGPSSTVKILLIEDVLHPAYGQSGLFAARPIAPGSLIVPYYGMVHPSDPPTSSQGQEEGQYEKSDYDLWLDREANVAVDAEKAGNEARFINDYRGTGVRPNAEFKECWDERRGEKVMGVFALPAGKGGGRKKSGGWSGGCSGGGGGGKGIKKGEEILVSYGKGFWQQRRLENEHDKLGDIE